MKSIKVHFDYRNPAIMKPDRPTLGIRTKPTKPSVADVKAFLDGAKPIVAGARIQLRRGAA